MNILGFDSKQPNDVKTTKSNYSTVAAETTIPFMTARTVQNPLQKVPGPCCAFKILQSKAVIRFNPPLIGRYVLLKLFSFDPEIDNIIAHVQNNLDKHIHTMKSVQVQYINCWGCTKSHIFPALDCS